jgi:hydrogenase maturation protease
MLRFVSDFKLRVSDFFRPSDLGLRISPDPASIPLLVLGYGNTLRSDDGVGPKVAETVAALKLPGVEAMSYSLLTPELSEPVASASLVVFVDAALDASSDVELRPLEPAASSQLMAHAANPPTLLALARDLFGHAPEAWCLAIPVENIGIGEDLSPLARRGGAMAVERIRTLAASVAADTEAQGRLT